MCVYPVVYWATICVSVCVCVCVPALQVYGMFLDTLSRFIQEHREYLDDWLFILLLKLLQRAGTDMLSSVLFKLQMVLEHVR
jgi:CLIP-associating protein 1/2